MTYLVVTSEKALGCFVASFVGRMIVFDCSVVGLRTRIGTLASVGSGIQIVVVGSTIGGMPASPPEADSFDLAKVDAAIEFVPDYGRCLAEVLN